MEENKILLRSLILQYFPMEIYLELRRVTMMHDIDNNEKGARIKLLLSKYNVPYTSLGSGTNRMAILIDGYAVKIALDADGMIDNRREMLYSKDLQPYVVKVYECSPTGLIAVCEYVTIFSIDDYRSNQEEMRSILKIISNLFLIGDVGISSKNYVNWGIRNNGSICMLDFAYIYSVQFKLFICSCDNETMVVYDKDYVNLKCPSCGRTYSFGDIRKKVTKEKQELEIGNIRRLGYTLTQAEELCTVVPAFDPYYKEKKETKRSDKKHQKVKAERQDWDNPVQEF